MYLSKIQINNFRIIQNLELDFNEGLNLLVGENDSGKSAIIDAIKFVLGTHSNDWLKLTKDDFFTGDGNNYKNEIIIICIFKGLTEDEAALFLEWLSIEDGEYYLKLTFKAKRKEKNNSISEISYDIKAGEGEESGVMNGEARNKLRATYLKPLRDAEYELAPRKGSRLSQILANYDIFQTEKDVNHTLVDIMNTANSSVNEYFESGTGKVILEIINERYLKDFSLTNNGLKSKLDISGNELGKILEKLELKGVSSNEVGNLGLGSNNLLFIAVEMLLLKDKNYVGLKLSLIEEIEAHLHPQSQINLIDFLSKHSGNIGVQSIITTHSNSLASKVDLNNLIICKKGNAFSLRKGETKLNPGDYEFLKRFLDDTKANLFFAKGVIMVEGDAENLFLPTFAEFIGRPLHKYGVSIVNVGSTALLRYAKIFHRTDNETVGIKVACITDRDFPPQLAKDKGLITTDRLFEKDNPTNAELDEINEKIDDIKSYYNQGDVNVFISDKWTLEYDIALNNTFLREISHISIQIAKKLKNLANRKNPKFELGYNDFIEVIRKCKKDLKDWQDGGDSDIQIALNIYEPLLKKQASKATSAQYLAHFLALPRYRKPEKINEIKQAPHLQYLINAIKHVTNVQP